MKTTKHFFSRHSKSSAAVVAFGLHAVLFIVGLSMVVITQVIEPAARFVEAPKVERAQAPLPKLLPPTSVREARPNRPNYDRFKVNPRMDRKPPPIALPDMKGLAGDLGSASAGSGAALNTIAFAIPEFKIFNVRGKGEKIFLILDAGDHMLEDRMGGIPAFTIIKGELNRIVNELPPTAVFNVCAFGSGQTWTLFPNLVAANHGNAARVELWLAPLNAADASAATGRYGIRTLGAGGTRWNDDFRRGEFAENAGVEGREYREERWFTPAMVAMAQRADTVFLLTNTWGSQRAVARDKRLSREDWLKTSAGKRWLKAIEESKELFKEENRRRAERGEPPRVIAHGNWGLVAAYRPNAPRPPSPEYRYFTPRDFKDAFKRVRAEGRGARKLKDPYSFNVIRFTPADAATGEREDPFKKLAGLCGGGYQTIAGLEAIHSFFEDQ